MSILNRYDEDCSKSSDNAYDAGASMVLLECFSLRDFMHLLFPLVAVTSYDALAFCLPNQRCKDALQTCSLCSALCRGSRYPFQTCFNSG